MNNSNYPLSVSKNINDETEITEENIENNLVFCIDAPKAFAIKSVPRSDFRNPSHRTKYVYFFISVKL